MSIYVDGIALDVNKKTFETVKEERATKELKAFYHKMESKQFPISLKRVTGEAFDSDGNPNPRRIIAITYSIPSHVDEYGMCRWVYSSSPMIDGKVKANDELLEEGIIINRHDLERAFMLIEKTGLVGPRGHYKIIDEAADADMFAEISGEASYVNTMLYTRDVSPLFGVGGEDKVRKIAMAMGLPDCGDPAKNRVNQVKLKIYEYTQANDVAPDVRIKEQSKRIKEFRELLEEKSNFKLKYTIQLAEDKGFIRYDTVSHEWLKAGGEGTWRMFFTNKSLDRNQKIESLISMLEHNDEKRNELFELIGMDVEPVEEEELPAIEKITTFAAAKKWAKKFDVYQDGDTLATLKEKLIPFLE